MPETKPVPSKVLVQIPCEHPVKRTVGLFVTDKDINTAMLLSHLLRSELKTGRLLGKGEGM